MKTAAGLLILAALVLLGVGRAGERAGAMQALALRAAAEQDLPPALLLAIGAQESEHRNVQGETGPEIGPMQIKPGTWAMLRCEGDAWVARDSYRCGARYLRWQLERYGDTCLAVQAYHDGSAGKPCAAKGSYAHYVLLRAQYAEMTATVRQAPRLTTREGG